VSEEVVDLEVGMEVVVEEEGAVVSGVGMAAVAEDGAAAAWAAAVAEEVGGVCQRARPMPL
jgi:hypothetical protein